MEVNSKTKNNHFSSFPANYVTLAQLQERWLKERQREMIQKQQEEEAPVQLGEEDHTTTTAEPVPPETEVAGEEETKTETKKKKSNRWKKNRKASEESEPPLLNVDGGGKEESDSRVLPVNREIGKRNDGGKRREIACENGKAEKIGLGPKFRILPGEEEYDNGDGSGGKGKGVALDRTADIDPRPRNLPVSGEMWRKKKKNDGKGRKTRGEDRAEKTGLDERDEVEAGLRHLSVDVNGNEEVGPARRSREGRKTRGGTETTGSVSNEVVNTIDVEPKVGVSSVRKGSGGTRRNEKKREEKHEKDWRDGIEPESKALSANEGSGKNRTKEDMWARRNRKSGQIDGKSKKESNKLDQSTGEESRDEATAEIINGEGRRRVDVKTEFKEDETARRDREKRKVISRVDGWVIKGKGGSRKSGGGGRPESGNSEMRRSSSSYNNRGFGGSQSNGFGRLGRDRNDNGMVWVKKEEVGKVSGKYLALRDQ